MTFEIEISQFLTALNQVVFQDVKKSFQETHFDAISIEFNLQRNKNPQLSLQYCGQVQRNFHLDSTLLYFTITLWVEW